MTYFSDPYFQFQSFLSGLAEIGSQDLDERSPVLRINPVWDDYRGDGVRIAIPGVVDRLHPDIVANYDTSNIGTFDPLSFIPANPEAAALSTFWAGLAAADDNDFGMVGLAPDATIVGFESGFPEDVDILVVPSAIDRTAESYVSTQDITEGRGGLGVIAIANNPVGSTLWGILDQPFASGLVNTDFEQHNQREVISITPMSAYGRTIVGNIAGDMTLVSIPVYTDTSSLTYFDDVSPTIGPDPRGDLGSHSEGTTLGFWELLAETQTGVEIDGGDYWRDVSGIGGSAVASGIVALILEANPDLGWRDVQEILAYSAELANLETDDGTTNSAGFPWEINAAKTFNGGGLHYNAHHGFGVIDPYGAVRLAETWTKTSTSENEAEASATLSAPLPSGEVEVDRSYSFTFTADDDIKIEHVELFVDYSAPTAILEDEIDGFIIRLISPDGTVSDLSATNLVFEDLKGERLAHSYSSRNFWGETSQQGDGVWTVEFTTDEFGGTEIEFHGASLSFFGDEAVDDDIYIFTDEFNDLDDFTYDRSIDDGSGINRINAAAMTSNLALTAVAGGQATAGGELLYELSGGSEIFHLIGGDGDDSLTGSDLNNFLQGMRGDDTLAGGGGADTIAGGVGRDFIDGGQGNDTLFGGAGIDEILGNIGEDVIFGHNGDDTIRGGASADTIYAGNGWDTVYGGLGTDTVFLGNGFDTFYDDAQAGVFGADTVFGGAGNDKIFGGAGADDFRGGTGEDLIFGAKGDDALYGGLGADVLHGQFGNDVVTGGNGRDVAYLGFGRDRFEDNAQSGFLGSDTVFGGMGQDTIRLSAGNDIATGGLGLDTFVFFGSQIEDDTVKDFSILEDSLSFDDALWGGGLTEAQVVGLARVTGAGVVFDFGAAGSVTLEGVNTTTGLEGVIDIF